MPSWLSGNFTFLLSYPCLVIIMLTYEEINLQVSKLLYGNQIKVNYTRMLLRKIFRAKTLKILRKDSFTNPKTTGNCIAGQYLTTVKTNGLNYEGRMIMHFSTQVGQNLDDQNLALKQLPIVLDKLNAVIDLINKNPQLQRHLKTANTTRQQIIVSFNAIVDSLRKLQQSIREGENLNYTAFCQIFTKLSGQLNNIPTNASSINQAIWVLEKESKIFPCLVIFTSPIEVVMKQTSPSVNWWETKNLVSPWKAKMIFQSLSVMIDVASAATISEAKVSSFLMKKLIFGVSFTYYLFRYKTAKLVSMGFDRKPEVKLAAEIYNGAENGVVGYFSQAAFGLIATNKELWIPVGDPASVNPETLDIFAQSQDDNTVKVRLLYHQKLPFAKEDSPETVMIYTHGGGFIAMSSYSAQIFTRKWANELKIPIFCIDYRKPPIYRFPTAPQDAFQVYKYLVNNIEKYMNIKPKNIILAGDSAGGNIACALTALILKNKDLNLPIPQGMFLAYPATDLRKKYTPSLLNAFDDPLMQPSPLLLCANEYINYNSDNGENPLASPLLLTQGYISGNNSTQFPSQWPKTVIFCGEKDPLLDDSIRFAKKIRKSGQSVKMTIYSNFPHGFLNLGPSAKEFRHAIKDSVKAIKTDILDQINKK